MLWARLKFTPRKNSICTIHNAVFTDIYSQTKAACTVDFTRLLDACIKSKSLIEGKKIHQVLIKNQNDYLHLIPSPLLEKVTHLYIACNRVELARHVFDEISNPSVIIWNLMIRAYAWNGPFEESLRLYWWMLDSGMRPTKFTFPSVLKACSGLQALEEGKEIHDHVRRLGLESDVFVCTALIDLYAKCGDLVEARGVFDGMSYRDVVAWNAIIAGFSLHGKYEETIQLLLEMQKERINPNYSTIVGILPTVALATALRQGKAIHGFCVRRVFTKDVVVATALLDMYAKCYCLSYARGIFDMMEVWNEVTWSAMIGAYVMCNFNREALELYDEMMIDNHMIPSSVTLGIAVRACAKLTDLSKGRCLHCFTIKSGLVLDLMVSNTLISMYAKCGIIEDALRFFDGVNLTDTVSYSAIISGYVQNGNVEEALRFFQEMQLYGIEPDMATMIAILPACSHLAALQHGTCGHSYSIVRGFVADTSICNALIDMYSKCGKICIARAVFDRILKRDIVSWNTMIIGYGMHGLGMEALVLFHDMLAAGLNPDDVTFICLLSACTHSGLVVEGKHWFNAMSQDFDIVPRMDHYVCMVDLLSRAGLLTEVHNFIEEMPFEPDVHVWSAVLAGCRIHKNIEFGEEISRKIHRLGTEGTGNFVLLSNMYSAVGRWDDAAQIRIMQKDLGFKKSPGCSWIEIGGVVHAFIGGDRSHPQSVEINKKLDELLAEMKKLGYCAESSFVLQDIEEEEKERILLYHSEKLAIAFGILRLGPSKPILITKNLRVCGDCHTAIKLITLVTKRDITVRDASRFHHFKNGICNCGDFW
ncbi:pentatricopeptide repeat-containing protein [Tripterygium wilfordii]|uniref:Pentatricopeptide repeat-containing protein n=1 Tax=Tripterygium wilfordii TaxID=458696 RepID=A0A7J7CJ88_TRIWF|nr:pentatricopeptide repeat-containing protein At3g16610 [Tripterygium wilfordii]KAF5734071.1 pentatricopeptide repeat-containing protein [Tripterygium wilfordii]